MALGDSRHLPCRPEDGVSAHPAHCPGDYLLTLDLPGSEGLPEGPTLLEGALGTLGLLVRTSCEAAQALAGAGAVPLLRDLLEYSSPEVVESASRLCAALCARSKAARREVLESASSALLGCALAAADDPGLVGEAARRLAVIVGDCPPADLAALTAERGALWTALRACQAKTGGGDAPDSATIVSTFSKVLALVRGCLDRAQRTQRLAPRQWPRGPGWDAVPREVRTLVLPPPAAGKDTQPLAFPTLPKGFLRRDGKAEERPVGQASSYKNSSVTIQELEATAPPTPDAQSPGDTHSEASAQTRCADDAHGPECLPDLRTVYDSTPLDAATRRARSVSGGDGVTSRRTWASHLSQCRARVGPCHSRPCQDAPAGRSFRNPTLKSHAPRSCPRPGWRSPRTAGSRGPRPLQTSPASSASRRARGRPRLG